MESFDGLSRRLNIVEGDYQMHHAHHERTEREGRDIIDELRRHQQNLAGDLCLVRGALDELLQAVRVLRLEDTCIVRDPDGGLHCITPEEVHADLKRRLDANPSTEKEDNQPW